MLVILPANNPTTRADTMAKEKKTAGKTERHWLNQQQCTGVCGSFISKMTSAKGEVKIARGTEWILHYLCLSLSLTHTHTHTHTFITCICLCLSLLACLPFSRRWQWYYYWSRWWYCRRCCCCCSLCTDTASETGTVGGSSGSGCCGFRGDGRECALASVTPVIQFQLWVNCTMASFCTLTLTFNSLCLLSSTWHWMLQPETWNKHQVYQVYLRVNWESAFVSWRLLFFFLYTFK